MSKKSSTGQKKNLSQYTGYYQWDTDDEICVSTLKGNLVMISLPSDTPGDSMLMFKHIHGDRFQRIRDDRNLGESLIFERNSNGEIYRLKRFDNWLYSKVAR